jgi:hypothetical protein
VLFGASQKSPTAAVLARDSVRVRGGPIADSAPVTGALNLLTNGLESVVSGAPLDTCTRAGVKDLSHQPDRRVPES